MATLEETDRVQVSLEAFSKGLNCAQAIATAFQDVYEISPAKIEAHKRNGAGHAPGGVCGALYAVLELTQDAVQREALGVGFADIAGNTRCRAIRKEKRITCRGCVEAAAVLLEEIARRGPRPQA